MKKKLRIFTAIMLIGAVFFTLAGCGSNGTAQSGDEQVQTEQETASSAEESVEVSGIHHVKIEIKDYGTIALELDGDTAPVTVGNFLKLAGEGFYDGLTFHRIMDGFMIQGGDPAQNGGTKSAEPIVGEFSSNGYENDISHKEGVISMARTGDPDSASSQFFITVADSEFLDGDYAAFGYVTEGLEIAKKIASDAEPIDENGTIPYEDQPVIETITVLD